MTLDEKYSTECKAVGFEYIGKSSRGGYSVTKCMVCGGVAEYKQANIRCGKVRCKACHETKLKQECLANGFEWLMKVDKNNSLCRCITCGHEDTFQQSAMRDGRVKCSQCHDTKMIKECLDAGFEWLRKVDGNNSLCRCLKCGHEDTYSQDNMRNGRVKCSQCHDTKMINECLSAGFEWIRKVDRKNSLCRCLKCGHEDVFHQGNMRDGKVRCPQCQLSKYQQAAKDGWTFINHFRKNGLTYVNLKHNCCDDLVKVQTGNYMNGSYDCPHCMHTHYSDPSFFYVIQVETIVKLGISNRPDHRYTQYGLPDDATIIEHLRIPLENKRDALVVESYAKQLVREYKLQTDVAKQVFTQSGYNECYSLESLDHLLTI